MPVTMFKKEQLSIPYDVDKCRINNRRYNAFIKNCIKDLKTKGETICFSKTHIEQIQEQIELTEICYDERNDCYYLFSKTQNKL